MANQVDPSPTLAPGASVVHGESEHGSVAATTNIAQLGPFPSFHGRRISWIAVSVITAGFLVGGLALIFGHHGPTWWLFWVGVGASVVGMLLTFATNTFEDWY